MSRPQASFPPARPAGASSSDRPAASSAASGPAPPPAAQPRATPSAGQALRALLNQHGENILQALRALTAVDFARLHDLFSQTLFNALVREHTTPSESLNWADQSDTAPPAPFLAPDTPPGDDRPATPPGATPDPRPVDPASVYIEHDIEEGEYFWRDISPPLSARRGRNGPWYSQEGWVIRPQLPSQPQRIDRPDWWPYPELFMLCPEELPMWVEIQPPAQPLEHLPVRGYCTFPCQCRRPCGRCYGLCLRPVHLGERKGHGDHKCYNCLKARAE